MKKVALYWRVSPLDQDPESPDGATAAKKVADTICDPMRQAISEAWEHALRIGIEYGYHAAERHELLPEAIERALRASRGQEDA